MIRGVVFDLDGTLLDTEKLYRRFWVEAARQMGYPMEDRHALMIRSMAAEKAERLLRREVCAEFDYHAVRALRPRADGSLYRRKRRGAEAANAGNAELNCEG